MGADMKGLLQGELIPRRESVLFPADLSIVLRARLVQLEASVFGNVDKTSLVCRAFTRGHRGELAGNAEVLMQDTDRIDA